MKRLTERLGLGRAHLYRLMMADTRDRPGARRLADAAQYARQMAAELVKAAEDAERVAAKGSRDSA